MTQLTEPQQRLLDEVRTKGTVRKNGRARRTVEALQRAGLVNVEYDLVPHVTRPWTERFTLTPVRDKHGNMSAAEGCSRCECGCKYWENDKCVDCGTRHDAARHDRDDKEQR